MAICLYCTEDKDLCQSHAVPDGFFKLISRKNNGKLITIPEGPNALHLTQNTGKSSLLCEQCEAIFNTRFDAPIVNAFKDWDKQIIHDGFSVRYEFSPNQMAQALVSIIWRACETHNVMYNNSKIRKSEKTQLLSIIKSNQDSVFEKCSCSIRRIYAYTENNNSGFSQKEVSQIILPPFAYQTKWGKSKKVKGFAFDILLVGFLCHLFFPKLPSIKSNGAGFLNPKNHKLHAPPYHFMQYEPLRKIAIAGYSKHASGNSKLKK